VNIDNSTVLAALVSIYNTASVVSQ